MAGSLATELNWHEAKILLMMQSLLLELNSGGAIMIAFSYPVQVEYSDYTCVKSYVSV